MKFNQVKSTKSAEDGIVEAIKLINKDTNVQLIISASIGRDIGYLENALKEDKRALYNLIQLVFDYGALCGKNKIGIPKLIPKDTIKDPVKVADKNIITG